MIIDFNFPNLTSQGWVVNVSKTTKNDKLFVQKMKFENKDDAFAYYEHVKQMWRNQKQRG